MFKIIAKIIALLLLISLFACKSSVKEINPEEYKKSIQEWQQKRLANLKAESGWLNLVGLYWLKDGQNPFGSNEANNIVFPENAPEFIGTIILYKGNLSATINPDIDVYINDTLIKEHDIITDNDPNTTSFKLGSLRWHII